MTFEERIASLHTRMDALRERRERQKTAWLCAGCGALTVCLILLIIHEGRPSSGGTAGLYSGATLLYENAGGYVTVAAAAFTAGFIITAAWIRYRMKHESKAEPDGARRADGQRGKTV